MNRLGDRLEAALMLLQGAKDNTLFADIGSDHAYLAIEAVKRNIAKSAVASDINELPLIKGRQNAAFSGIDIDFILSDGFKSLESFPLTSAAICGMGGELIARIIAESEIAKRIFLILQPMSMQEELRKYLWDNGFCIEREIFVYEAGKAYSVMQVCFDGIKREYSILDLYLGKQRDSSFEFSKYCEKILNTATKRRIGIVARGESTAETDSLIEYCQTQRTSF